LSCLNLFTRSNGNAYDGYVQLTSGQTSDSAPFAKKELGDGFNVIHSFVDLDGLLITTRVSRLWNKMLKDNPQTQERLTVFKNIKAGTIPELSSLILNFKTPSFYGSR